jgi:hypothetical protein
MAQPIMELEDVGPPMEDGQTTNRHTLQGDLKTLDHRWSASQNARYDARSVFGWANVGIARWCMWKEYTTGSLLVIGARRTNVGGS